MFKKSNANAQLPEIELGWKVLIVDDEPGVHSITRIALNEFVFDGKGLDILSAHSGKEAQQVFSEHPDIALVYLDVVMETDDAGLRFVQYVRETLNNQFVRIILRTGQPGHAPERDVIVNYDINGYKEKTNFDSNKLFTATYSALRSYKDIMEVEVSRRSLDRYRKGLELVINASANLFEIRSLKKFAEGLLFQIGSILHLDRDTLLVRSHAWTVAQEGHHYRVLAGTGAFGESKTGNEPSLPGEVRQLLDRACQSRQSVYDRDKYIGYFPTKSGTVNLIYLDGVEEPDELDKRLLQLFSSNVTIAFDNLYLDREIFETQTEIIDTLGDVVESRSKEAANHVKRVAHLARMLGLCYGLSEQEADNLYMAAPMHDIGKVAIPDSILLKPGKLDAEEWRIMQTHAQIGADIFAQSKRPVLQAAAIVAGQHHEKYDGSGYPNSLSGKNIHVYGRIVAVVDVFDALAHKRCYKDAWPLEKVVAFLEEQKGAHLDPELVDVFLSNMDKIKEILEAYPD